MPSLAAFHPQVVHFVVALIIVGVLFRLLSLAVRVAWLSPAALALITLGTLASLVAVRSGADAHGPVERVPGARPAVVEHEEWGERARNAFLLLLAVEAVAATLTARKVGAARTAQIAAAVAGLAAVGVLYRAADLGGRLVYGYAGGVAVNTGDPEDVSRLLIAAAHQQANADRQAGRLGDAAAILDVVADRFPAHLELQLARVDSIINDRKDPAAALSRLDALRVPTEDTRLRVRAGLLRSGALAAAGDLSAARQVLETLKSEFPANTQVQRRLAELAQAR
ncbi:DUF2231 domain-containing protein [Luteitalea sp.]|uniref:DUF2231 domain-containing protein n=1 Tax=Luteitalea sp. TaxID=2004800 RepID=UPI0025C1FF91|nr:DUF2231 domain-containing protein [Luteitalea sp.]